ncbi:MAG: hypothetical protein HS113_01515 [Verrucomicrobiales bacterium]|nr:hypothetical protein [Verrucomicrobiales bacterium]
MNLTDEERVALEFVRAEKARGHFPSVRDVARVIGAKSSRSGARVVNRLIENGLIRREGGAY